MSKTNTGGKDKEATQIMMAVLGQFYKKLTSSLSQEERKALSDRVREESGFPSATGQPVVKAVFNFNCPETEALVTVKGFNVHANVDPATGDIQMILTVDCPACKKEHPVTVISIPEMLSVPALLDVNDA